jgi:iron-sulfur cluster assembly protein|tara:strand:+ start:204 stop:590 length:387 start_codon:yes stop_codon:yes gene_type:complete
MSITLTEESASVLLSYMNKEKPIPEYVRFGVKAGGCSGFTYTIGFDSQSRKFDLDFESCGVKLLVDKKSHLYVKNTIIGWSNQLQDKGFKFDNPAAKGACGCKTSFQIDLDRIVEKKKRPNWMNSDYI